VIQMSVTNEWYKWVTQTNKYEIWYNTVKISYVHRVIS
jgi:hypothetical protein